MSLRIVYVAVAVALVAITASSPSAAQSTTVLWHLGFGGAQAPSSSIAFRRAVAFAVDRGTIAGAIASVPPGGKPVTRIQHSHVTGDTRIPITGQRFDATRAQALLKESGWSGPIAIVAGGSTTDWTAAFEQAVTRSLERSLGLTVTIKRLESIGAVVHEVRAGRATVFLAGWRSNPRDFGYPWISTGLAQTYFPRDKEMQALIRTRQVLALEQLMLEKAYIVPIVSY
jgi:extracellular solute-binding protein (family 5)